MSGPSPSPSPAPPGPRPQRSTDRGSWGHWLPGLQTLRHYPRPWLRHDLVAGLVLATMLVPVGIAYATAAGLPGVHGLYTTIVVLLAYALFGPSRILVLGPDSSLAPLILAVVLPLSAGDPARAVALAGVMAVVSGLVCIAAGAAQLGFVTELLSKPIRYGYMNGIAIAVILSQLPPLLGFTLGSAGPMNQVAELLRSVWAGRTNLVAAGLGIGVLVLIMGLKRWPRAPGLLLAIAAATAAVALFDLDRRFGVAVLGPVPEGLPSLTWPSITRADWLPVLSGGIVVALVSFADTSVLSRSLAYRSGRLVDANHEMVALGAANLAAGFFQGFPVSSSASRTPVAEAAGARSQLTGVVGALAVAALLLAAPALLRSLPSTALAAVVIVAAFGLIEWRDLLRIWRIQRWEFWLSIVCMVGVLLLGAIEGIALAVVIAVIEFLWDGWRPHTAVLGHVQGIDGFHDIARHPEARRVPGLVLFRWDAPLFFANAEFFQARVLQAVDDSPTPVGWMVVAAEPVTSIDVTAADALAELDQQLQDRGIELCFAEMKGPVKDKLKRFGLFGRFGQQTFFATVDEAVQAYLAAYPRAAAAWHGRDDTR
jgi:high affinity sulfate transporter 1